MKSQLSLLFALLLFFPATILAQVETPGPYDSIATAMFNAKKAGDLITYLETEREKKGDNAEVLRMLGFAYLAANKPELAEERSLQSLKLDADCSSCWRNIASSYWQRENKAKAMEYFAKALELKPNSGVAYSMRAKCNLYFGDKFAALMDFNKSIEVDPTSGDCYYERAAFNASQGFYSIAISDMNKATWLTAKKERAPCYQRRAEYYKETEQYEFALLDIDSAMLTDRKNIELYNQRGMIHERLEQLDEAIADYKMIIALDSNDLAPYNNLALLVHNKKQDMDGGCYYRQKAIELLQRTSPSNPLLADYLKTQPLFCDDTKPNYYFQRAIALSILGQQDKAIAMCDQTLKRFPGNSMTINARGDAYYYSKQFAKAKADYLAVIGSDHSEFFATIALNFNEMENMPKDSLKLFEDATFGGVWMQMAQCDFAMHNMQDALSDVKTAVDLIKINMGNGMEAVFEVRAATFLALGMYDEAINDLDLAARYLQTPEDMTVRAVAKLCRSMKYTPTYASAFRAKMLTPFIVNWLLPEKVKPEDSYALNLALRDCNNIIGSYPKCAYAYFIRGQILRLTGSDAFCADFAKAKELGFDVDKALTKRCPK